jgi:uncharacterized protein
MNSKERRKYIEDLLTKNKGPQKGYVLAEELGVTRQVIVKDIAISRAEGKKIIATPEGYLLLNEYRNAIERVVALNHKSEDIREELSCIVKHGGVIKDVIVEHPLYGEIKGMLMIRCLDDVDSFIKRISEYKAEPLLVLTGGVHLHTIETENMENMNDIIEELKKKAFLISD